MLRYKKMSLPTSPEEMLEYIGSLGVGVRSFQDQFFNEGDVICGTYTRYGIIDIDEEPLCHDTLKIFKCDLPFCSLEFDNIVSYELHYNSTHRYACSQCKKQLPSPHLLDLHLSETHDSFFKAASEKKPMFRCFVENCSVVSPDPKSRRSHCIEEHKYPHDFKFDVSFRKLQRKKKKSGKSKTKEEKVQVDDEAGSAITRPFSFGHRGYRFGSRSARSSSSTQDTSIELNELMDTLPPIE